MSLLRETAFLFSLSVFTAIFVRAQSPQSIDFYGVISPDADKNMVKMTEDLYYAQLKDLLPKVNDFREKSKTAGISPDGVPFIPEDGTSLFYAVITRTGDALSTWKCRLYLKLAQEEQPRLLTKEYDSYYKILMESKTALAAMFGNNQKGTIPSEDSTHQNDSTPQKETGADRKNKVHDETTTEQSSIDITGTWTGGEDIAKAVIMKGGRGFIIFKNGASMNISVSTEISSEGTASVTLRQLGHSNASFFPELERSAAVDAAKTAEPVEWNMELSSGGTLSGNKKTIVHDSMTGELRQGLVPVTWTRKQ